MSKESGDALRIPIEIKTDDLQELNSLIQDITDAQSAVRELTPRRGKGDSSSRSAVSPSSNDGFGIFSSSREGEVLPSKGRDKSSRQAFQRESEFEKLKERVEIAHAGQKSLDAKLNSIMSGVFGVNIATGGIQSAGPIFSSAGKIVSGGGAAGMIAGLAAKLVAPIGAALLAVGFIETIISELFKPGGPFDIRFKRNFQKESNILTSLEQKMEIRAGRRIIRTTTISSLRGSTRQQFSTLDMLKHGIAPYDLNGAAAARNII